MIEVTEKAAQILRQQMEKENRPDAIVRLAVKGGGCSGLTYALSFEDAPREYDKVFEGQGIRMVVDKKSYIFLNGTVLDYTSNLMASGFEFKNPNAKKSCGCGTSFSA